MFLQFLECHQHLILLELDILITNFPNTSFRFFLVENLLENFNYKFLLINYQNYKLFNNNIFKLNFS
jgi:hypothetical protein